MRVLPFLLSAASLLVLLAVAIPGQADPTAVPPSPPPALGDDVWERALALGDLEGDVFAHEVQRLLLERPESDPALARYAVVPESIFRGAHAVCDLDGDGVRDLVSNDMQLRRNGEFDSGFSTLRALSGVDGREMWQTDNQLYYNFALGNAYSAFRPGQPSPIEPPNMIPIVDVDGDGTCDVLAYGFAAETLFATPIFGSPSVTLVDVTVRALSGKDGSAIWTAVATGTDIDATDPLYPIESSRVIRNFPTGFAFAQTPDGPRLLLKTTDFVYAHVQDPFEMTAPVVDGDTFWYNTLFTGEHIFYKDVATGADLWKRDYEASPDADNINITWVSGIDDLTGDGHPDVVFDQFTLSNPRGAQFTRPDTGEPMYRYGRGMRMFALDGQDGGDLWHTTLIDPLAVQTPPPGEENLEILAWTHGSVPGDVDGDGKADPVAQYLAEEMVGGTPNGRHRTHFILLDGATGEPRWDHRQQGWGFLTRLGPQRVATGTLDLPEGNADGARPPVKALRISGLDAATGNPIWTYEEPLGQDSTATYEIGLHQIRTRLAPLDLDGDGLLEVVTPSRYQQPEGTNQVFLATARQDYQVLDGQTGRVERTFQTWGSNALLLPCSSGSELTFVVGHARRLDLVRIDADSGQQLLRRAIWNHVEARASMAGIDLMGLAGSCSLADGRLTYAVNMEAFSMFRRYEIVPLIGVLQQDGGAPLWRDPEVQPAGQEPPTPSLLETLAHPKPLIAPGVPLVSASVGAAVAGLALGGLLGIPTGRWLSRRRQRFDPLGLAMLLIVLPGAGVGGVGGDAESGADAGPLAPLDVGVADVPEAASGGAEPGPQAPRVVRDALALSATEEVRRWSLAQMGLADPDVSERFDENHTLTFTHPLADVDADGVQDIALDVYCTSCYNSWPGLLQPVEYTQRILQPEICGPEHTLVVLSGARGDRLWDQPLDRGEVARVGGLTTSCSAEAVVGVVPLPDGGSGILMYRFESIDVELGMTGKLYNHTLYLRDGATGRVLWEFQQSGYLTPTYLNGYEGVAVNNYLNPMLVKPESHLVVDRMGGAELGLFVQGHGFRFGNSPTVSPPGLDHGPRAEDAYDPIEWLARLDPVTGELLWRADSFQPVPGRSILPFPSKDSLFRDQYFIPEYHEAYDYPFPLPAAVPVNTWGDVLCCGDLTGDGVFDPAFTTLEWTQHPNANTGPLRFDSNLVAFDGATGERLYQVPIVHDVDGESAPNRKPFWRYPYDNLRVWMKGVGDLDGDGSGDILLRIELVYSDYDMEIRAVEGGSGTTLWSQEFPRAQAMLTLGDANGDGGNDVLFADWFRLERTSTIFGDETNVTRTPMRLREGDSGEVLYRVDTIQAPLDLQQVFATLARNGVPDLDMDGVGDFPIDDPIYLPDQITLHQLEFLSGRDASKILSIPVAGALAFPSALPDLTGDGRPEIAVLAGDPNDVWMTYRDGKDGSALWGHRALALKTSSYALTRPQLQVFPLVTGYGERDVGFILNMHIVVEAVVGEYETIYIDASGTRPVRQLYIDSITLPQLDVVLDPLGARSWSYPSAGAIPASYMDGETPGTAVVLGIREDAEPTLAHATARVLHDARIPIAVFGAAFAAALLAIALVIRRRQVPL